MWPKNRSFTLFEKNRGDLAFEKNRYVAEFENDYMCALFFNEISLTSVTNLKRDKKQFWTKRRMLTALREKMNIFKTVFGKNVERQSGQQLKTHLRPNKEKETFSETGPKPKKSKMSKDDEKRKVTLLYTVFCWC